MANLDKLRFARARHWIAIVGPVLLLLLTLKLAFDVATQRSFELLGIAEEPQNVLFVVIAATISLVAALVWLSLGLSARRTRPERSKTAKRISLAASAVAPVVVAALGLAILGFAIFIRVRLEVTVTRGLDAGLDPQFAGMAMEFGWGVQNGPALLTAGITIVTLAALWFATRPTAGSAD